MSTEVASSAYPVEFNVEYTERQTRWKTLLRLFLAIPVLLFAAIVGAGAFSASGGVMLAIWIAIIFRGRIPRWLFNFQVSLMRFQARAYGYLALLTDTYPPFEGEHPIRFEVQYPEKPSRWKVLIWKAITALPHFFVLVFLGIGAFFAVIAAWFAILFTGRYPKGLHGYVVGVSRWSLRVQGYLLSLTDEYPPFSLSDDAGPAGRDTYVISSIIGGLMTVGLIGLGVTAIVMGRQADRTSVSYAALKAGHGGVTFHSSREDITPLSATDPAGADFPALTPRDGKRFVSFDFELRNNTGRGIDVGDWDFHLKDSSGKNHSAQLTVVGGSVAPVKLAKHTSIQVTALFEIDEQTQPTELKYQPPTRMRAIIWELK